MEPFFTVVTATLNSETTLGRLFDSLDAQSFKNFEHIIVDGNSSDRTEQISLKRLGNNGVFLSEKDNGLYFAMNKGVCKARGKYICILNSDDFFDSETLSRVHDAWLESSSTDIFYGQIAYQSRPESVEFIDHQNLDKMMIYHPSCFVRSSLFEQLGFFDTKYKVAADYDFMLKARNFGAEFYPVYFPLAYFAEGGFSEANRWESIKETFYIQLTLSHNSKISAISLFVKSTIRFTLDKLLCRLNIALIKNRKTK